MIQLNHLLSDKKKKLERVKEAYENSVYTLDEFSRSRQQIICRIKELESKLAESNTENNEQAQQKLRERILSILPSLHSPAIPEQTKNSLIKSFVRRIVFYRNSCSIDVFFYM